MRLEAWGGEPSVLPPPPRPGGPRAGQVPREPLGWINDVGAREVELGGVEAGAAPAADRQTLPPPPSPLLLPLSPALSPEAAALAAQAGTAIRLAAWLALLFAGYGLQRGLCAGGLPSDCGAVVAGDIYAALTQLAFTGGALGALAGVMRPDRFAWLASPRRAWLWLAYLALFPAYSALSNIPALQASLATTGSWGPAMFALTAVVGAAVVAALAFHLWLAWRAGGGSGGGDSSSGIPAGGAGTGRAALPGLPVVFTAQMAAVADSGSGTSTPRSPCKHCRSAGSSLGSLSDAGSSGWDEDTTQPLHARARSVGSSLGGAVGVAAAGGAPVDASLRRRRLRAARWRCLGLYLLPRLAALAYFAAWLGGLPASGAYSLHLHHYALGFAVAIFAAFNHPVSGLVLALATAVFVQGVSAYGFDPLLEKHTAGGCLPVTSTTDQMTCSFWSDDPFALRFCSDTAWIPWFNCSVPWPWPETDISKYRGLSLNSSGTGYGFGGGGFGGGGMGGAAASPAAAPPSPWP